uniref:Dymeclin n=2 Tax=Oncorhynchus TaxID=8016 RepID=A0AAZ3P538_ONCTS
MGANTSQVSDLSENQSLRTLIGTVSISDNDPFWNQLISFTFISPTSSGNSKLLEEAVIPLAKILIENNPRTGNFGALVRIFLGRTKELKISTECQDQLFIWQAHNTLFMIRCLLKVFIREMTEEELHLQFSYRERVLGSYTGSEVLLEELMCNLVHLVVEVPLLDITYSILFEAVTTMLVLLSYQLFHKEILRDGLIYQYLMKGRCLSLTSQLVKTLLYNIIRQEKCPPPATHIFEQQSDRRGLLYGLASGVASGLWSVFALGGAGSKPGLEQEQNPLPLSNQSLLLLLVLANLTDGPNNCPNPYRQAVTCFKNTQDMSSVPTEQHHMFQINFNSLYTALCEQQRSDQATLILYTLLHQNTNMRTYMLSRTDMENLVMPILKVLYHVEDRNSHHVYMALIILLILTEEDTFNRSIHEVVLKNITWYSERSLTEISLGSLLILVVIRTIQFNMTRTRDKYLHTNCLAALANMSAQFRCLHQYAAQRIISLIHAVASLSHPLLPSVFTPSSPVSLPHSLHSLILFTPSPVSLPLSSLSLPLHPLSLFALLSKKHNKILEQATQSLRGLRRADYAQDLNVIEEVIRMMLEIINSCLSNSLHHNPNLVYALLYKRELFEQFRTHPSFQDIMQNLDTVIGFFSQRLEAAGTDLSVERVQEVIMKGAQALPKDRLKKFPELKFRYVEEDQPEDFFIPYVWSLVFNSGVGLNWSPTGIELFSMDSG